MTSLLPLLASDSVSRRPSDGGAEQRLPFFAAPSRHAAPLGSHPWEGRGSAHRTVGQPPRQDPSDILFGRILAWGLMLSTLFCLLPTPAAAQQAQTGKGDKASRDSKDILVTGRRPGSACNGEASAQPIDYACLNGELKTAAAVAQPTPSAADAVTSQATTPSKVGTFSHTATAQRMGQNFGHSAQPYRPPAPVYTNPVRGAGPR